MIKSTFKWRIGNVLIFFALVLGTGSAYAAVAMTPYATYQSPGTFWQGAMYDLPNATDFGARISHDLQELKDNYNINCLNLYGLESLSTGNKNLLFKELKRLGMQTVVRIEGYNGSWMNFEDADADAMINNYNSLIEYVCDSTRRDQVAYFALNVPVDDNTVADNFTGGRTNPLWASRQVSFVTRFVSQMRSKCSSYGFNDAKMYVSVFYGWDYSYTIPSYVSSNADGYFFNNYSYPQNFSVPPDEKQTDAVIINQARLQKAMNKFMGQYPTQNKVIEYGFHTTEFNGGAIPNQVAGLVKTRAAKQIALKATTNYYSPVTFPGMKGTQYFGCNLLKAEGTPLSLMDWCLDYPKKGITEAEDNFLYGHTKIYSDTAASNDAGIQGLDSIGDGIIVYNVAQNTAFDIRYSCTAKSQLSLYVNGTFSQKVIFPATGLLNGTYAIKTVTLSIPWGASIKLQRNTGDYAVNIDYLKFGEGDNPTTANNITKSLIPHIKAYPNPFHNEMKIILPEIPSFKKLLVQDATGRVIESKRLEGLVEFTMGSDYQPGVYLFQFLSPKGVESKIAIKQ